MKKTIPLFVGLIAVMVFLVACAPKKETTSDMKEENTMPQANESLNTEEENEADLTVDKESQDDTNQEFPPAPWETEGAKQPKDYSWAEFEALSGEYQMIFQKSFKKFEDFEKWMEEAQSQGTQAYPWEKEGAKQASEYTWEEFQSLSPELQMAFQYSFGSIENYDVWLRANEPQGE